MKQKTVLLLIAGYLSILLFPFSSRAQSAQLLLNEPVDLSRDFKDYLNTYFLADSLPDSIRKPAPGR